MPDRPPSIGEIAALTARLRALSDGRDADPAEIDRFLADKHELLDRITVPDAAARDDHPDGGRDPYDGYGTYTPATVADQLIAAGVPPDVARGVVDRYLDDLNTARGWEPAEGWEIDDGDVDAMLSRHAAGAGRHDPHLTSGQAPNRVTSAEDDQRAELNRLHDDDTTDGDMAARTDEDAAPEEVIW